MEVTIQKFPHFELLSIIGRADSAEAPRLEQALRAVIGRGMYKLVIDMSQLEYMSSAGLRALAEAQRQVMHHNRGEMVLTQVPDNVREALALVGFTEHFKIIDPAASALAYMEKLPGSSSRRDA
ncbi:MAG: STAS domain-containing protein [Chloroflexota bacterium]